jgi:Na+/melibiose symporter-like transporter
MSEEAKNLKENNPERLPFFKFLAWKCPDIGMAASFIVLGYLTIYCTDTLHMPAALVGALLLGSKVVDGITDLFAGFIVDRTKTRFGKGRPYEFCILGVWVSVVLMFSCPDLGLVGQSIWVFFTYTLVQSIFATLKTAAAIPYTVRAWPNRRVIVKLNSFGGIVTMLGSMIVSISFPMVMRAVATSAAGWTRLILIFAIPLCVISMLRFIFVKEIFEVDVPSASGEKIKMKDVFAVFKSNHYIWIVAGVMFLAQMYAGMNSAIYYFTWIVGDIRKYGAIQGLSIIMLVFLLLFPRMMKKFSIPNLITMGAAAGIVGCLLNFFAGSNMTMLGAALLFMGFASLPTSYLLTIMIIDCASYNEWKGKPRMDGTMATINNFGGKVGNGIGTAFLGILLGAAGYDGALSSQSESAILMIRSLYSIIPALIFVVMIVLAQLFTLPKLLPQIEKENAERRAAFQAQKA